MIYFGLWKIWSWWNQYLLTILGNCNRNSVSTYEIHQCSLFFVTKSLNATFTTQNVEWRKKVRLVVWLTQLLGTSLKQGEKVFKINVVRKCKWNDVTSKSLDCFAVVQRELVTVVFCQNEIAFCYNIVSYWLASCLN